VRLVDHRQQLVLQLEGVVAAADVDAFDEDVRDGALAGLLLQGGLDGRAVFWGGNNRKEGSLSCLVS
jgi:hypothetical protein